MLKSWECVFTLLSSFTSKSVCLPSLEWRCFLLHTSRERRSSQKQTPSAPRQPWETATSSRWVEWRCDLEPAGRRQGNPGRSPGLQIHHRGCHCGHCLAKNTHRPASSCSSRPATPSACEHPTRQPKNSDPAPWTCLEFLWSHLELLLLLQSYTLPCGDASHFSDVPCSNSWLLCTVSKDPLWGQELHKLPTHKRDSFRETWALLARQTNLRMILVVLLFKTERMHRNMESLFCTMQPAIFTALKTVALCRDVLSIQLCNIVYIKQNIHWRS